MSTLRDLLNEQLDALQMLMESEERSDSQVQRVVQLNNEMYGVLRRSSPANAYGGVPMNGDPEYRLVLDGESL